MMDLQANHKGSDLTLNSYVRNDTMNGTMKVGPNRRDSAISFYEQKKLTKSKSKGAVSGGNKHKEYRKVIAK